MKQFPFQKVFLFCTLVFTMSLAQAKDIVLLSPDKKIQVNVSIDDTVRWALQVNGETLLNPSAIWLQLGNNNILGLAPKLKSHKITAYNKIITAIVPIKQKQIDDVYNELVMNFKDDFSIIFRAYNDGVAYRFVTNIKQNGITILDEKVSYNFPADYRVFWSGEKSPTFQSHYENLYPDSTIGAIKAGDYAALPLLVQNKNGVNLLFSETDLYDYPNLFLRANGQGGLNAAFPKPILESQPVRDRDIRITKTHDYIAATASPRKFPWRTVVVATQDKDLLVNQLNFKLATPPAAGNYDWIKPGQVAWDWWNANNIYGVDFKSGINTETYKYYIDFAAKFGIPYIMLDEGWTKTTTDLLNTNPNIDVKALIDYGATKNVGVWLWCLWGPLDKDLDKILDQYVAWGAKGIKVDFMARAEQYMVNYYERVAKACMQRKLMVDLHGAYKPVGLHNQYPNVLTYEGVRGLENNKWEKTITPKHNVTLPFTRMVPGPMDYTPGAMINATATNFNVVFTQPMSMGTRAHQVAMYVLYESPLQMLADNPSNNLKESETISFITKIPTVWDETYALDGKVGEYAAVARKHGNSWYIGAMTNWKQRSLNVSLPFAKGKKYKAIIFKDGINSDKHASDYKIVETTISGDELLKIDMASGGGWTAILTEVN